VREVVVDRRLVRGTPIDEPCESLNLTLMGGRRYEQQNIRWCTRALDALTQRELAAAAR
jgi:hypothetical protein